MVALKCLSLCIAWVILTSEPITIAFSFFVLPALILFTFQNFLTAYV